MNILHISCVAPPEIGGIGRTAALEVAGLRARGFDARLVAPQPKEVLPREAEKSFIERIPPLFRIGNASILPGIMKRARYADVIHVHYPYYGVAEPLLWNSGRLPPIVVTFHMDAHDHGPKRIPFELHRFLLQEGLLRRAERVIVSSFDYARRSSLRDYFIDHAERMVELPFGVDTETFSPGARNRTRFMIPEDAFTVLFVGGLDRAHAFKGVPELLEAFSKLGADARLLIVGDGDLRGSYEARARELGIHPRTHFIGRVDQATLVDAYRSADVFAFPSLSKAEAFGLAALEAEACGLPVVASDLPGVRTVVIHGETGLLVPPGDAGALAQALDQLRRDDGLRERLSGQAVRHASGFTWERHIDGLIQTYRDVCASRS